MRTHHASRSARGPRAGLLLLSGLGGGLVLALSQCFSPTLPACSYQCAMEDPRCPEDYECREDGLCHLKGNNEVCPFDLSSAPDQARATGDMPAGDGGRD